MISPDPGDVLLVRRRPTIRAWLTRPVSSAISARIRAATASRWNHVACVVAEGWLVEAEWDHGVRRLPLADYLTGAYELAVAPCPRDADPIQAISFWGREARRVRARYDWRGIILMRVAGLLYGPAGIARRVQLASDDGAWICSELAAAGWKAGGLSDDQADRLLVPGDFSQFAR